MSLFRQNLQNKNNRKGIQIKISHCLLNELQDMELSIQKIQPLQIQISGHMEALRSTIAIGPLKNNHWIQTTGTLQFNYNQ